MPIIESVAKPRSKEFKQNAADMQALARNKHRNRLESVEQQRDE